jgi:ElaB/YqjD/DUF883 family membrane-anchored ribosome-binding protein
MPDPDRPTGNGEARIEQDANAAAAAFRDTMHEAEDYVKRQWRENPIGVAAIVAGLGVLLGLILGRRS